MKSLQESLGRFYCYGTFGVYINGSLSKQGVTDYYQQLTYGTKYKIVPHTNTNKTYKGTDIGVLEGTIGANNVSTRLVYNSMDLIDINGYLDLKDNSDIAGFGTCDVYVDGTLQMM